MVDINKWSSCVSCNPKKRGKYTLMIGKREHNWTNINVITGEWNGKKWLLDNDHVAIKWTYTKPGSIDKYPVYNMMINGGDYDDKSRTH